MWTYREHTMCCEHVTVSKVPKKREEKKLMAESNTNLFSGDLLFTTVFTLHWEFLANLIMRLKTDTRGWENLLKSIIKRIYWVRKSSDLLYLPQNYYIISWETLWGTTYLKYRVQTTMWFIAFQVILRWRMRRSVVSLKRMQNFWLPRICAAHLDIFKAKGDFAVFAVKGSGFTLSLVVAVFLAEKDEDLTRLALYALKFTPPFVLTLWKHKMNGGDYCLLSIIHIQR